MSACKESPTTPNFIINDDCIATVKPDIYLNPLNNHPLTSAPSEEHQGRELFRKMNCLGSIPHQNSILQDLEGL